MDLKQKQFKQTNTYVRYYPANTRGRDFVVGDMHGMKDFLLAGLAHLNFDPSVDRVFAVGDLIDRGTDSKATLRLLDKPWFDSTLGNHELMMMEGLDGNGNMYQDWLSNGGKTWMVTETRETLGMLVDEYIRQMPYVIVVGKDSPTRFNIVHAEFHNTKANISDQTIDGWENIIGFDLMRYRKYNMFPSVEDLEANAPHALENIMLWGRTLVMLSELVDMSRFHSGLSTTYVGHTPVTRVFTVGAQVYIDTGACYTRSGISTDSGLTIVNAHDKTFVNVNLYREDKFREFKLP